MFENRLNFIIYGDVNFENSKHRLSQEIISFTGLDSINIYGPNDLDQIFKDKFESILVQPRIAGYGIWRPHIIKKELQNVKENDFLIYIDAGCSINPTGKERFNEYLQMLDESEYGIISFQMHHEIEKWWTTKQIFDYFKIDINSSIANSGQILSGILIMKNNNHLRKIIDEWYGAVHSHPEMFTDVYNDHGQISEFKDNRHEQSVFSIIRKIHGSIQLSDETYFQSFGNEESLKYPIWATRIRG